MISACVGEEVEEWSLQEVRDEHVPGGAGKQEEGRGPE